MGLIRSLSYQTRTLYGGLILGAIVTLLALVLLQGAPFVQRAELGSYDWRFQLRGSTATASNIVVAGLDDSSIVDFGGKYPVPRAQIAAAVCFLEKAGVSAIGIDFSYFAPSFYGPADDHAFARCLRHRNIVLNEEIEAGGSSSHLASGSSLLQPIPEFVAAGPRLGLDNVPPDADNVIRSTRLQPLGFGGKTYPVMPLVLAAAAEHRTTSAVARNLPQLLRINYSGPQSVYDQGQSTTVVSLGALTQDPPGFFRHKIVMIIPAALRTQDTHETPFGTMFGGFVQSNTLNTILQRNPIIDAGDTANALILVILGLLTALLASRLNIWFGALTVLALLGIVLIGVIEIFIHNRLWLNLVAPETTIVLVFAAIMALRFATEERHKRRIHRDFGEYVAPDVVDILVNDPAAAQLLHPRRLPVSVLFVDIRGFTSMSEKMEPTDVVLVLDRYLQTLTECILRHGGTLDKYVGDEIMAIWNAPYTQGDHPMRAVRAGLDMIDSVEELNQQLASKGLPTIMYGIGVNSGEVVVGNMGSTMRKQYTVIGDAVNTGARLCSKAEGSQLIIGENTWELIGDQLEVEETETLSLKGKSAPLRTFQVLGVREERLPVLHAATAEA